MPITDWTIFTPALILVLFTGIGIILYPEETALLAQNAMDFITSNLGWLYLCFGIGALGFCFWLAFGHYGHVKLGKAGEAPEYSTIHWIALMFTAGIGGSIAVWGFAEPIFYLQTPPMGVEPHSPEAMLWAHIYPLFHWGIIPWAIYTVPAVPIAYMLYVKREPILRISAACEEALPQQGREGTKSFIDILIVLGLIGGTSTTLGLGVPFVSALTAELFNIPDSILVKLIMLFVWTLLFGSSSYYGLKKGIKILADINMAFAVIVIIFILLAGPTLFILSLTVNSIGMFLDNFWSMVLWTDPIEKSGFPETWTIFYWAWWLAYAAFMGLFVGRISRGRTIRQLVLGMMGWGTLGTCAFLTIAGGYSLYVEANHLFPVSQTLTDQGMFVAATKVMVELPLSKPFLLFVFTALCIIFYATTIDSAAYVLSSICTKNLRNDQEPPRYSRLVWAFALALLTAGLIISGGIRTAQSTTVVFSLPLIPIILSMSISMVRWLRRDFGKNIQTKELTLVQD